MKKNSMLLASMGLMLLSGVSALNSTMQTKETKEIPLIGLVQDDVIVANGANGFADVLSPLDELKMIAADKALQESIAVRDILDRLYLTADDLAFLQVEDDKKAAAAVSEIAQELLAIYNIAQANDNQAFIAALQAYEPTVQILPLPVEDQVLPLPVEEPQLDVIEEDTVELK